MPQSISIGQLRQNPTAMIRDVRAGATYTLTDRGQPVADIAPHRTGRWRMGSDVSAVLAALGPDRSWSAEQQQARDADAMARDPWDRAE